MRERENESRRVVERNSQGTRTSEQIEDEMVDTGAVGAVWHEGGGGEEAGEPLCEAVARHIARYLAAGREGTPLHDLHAQLVAEVERPLIQMTLVETRGNQIKAAAMLGLNRNTLRKKIRELDIPVVRGAG